MAKKKFRANKKAVVPTVAKKPSGCPGHFKDGSPCTTPIAKKGRAAIAGMCGPHYYQTIPRKKKVSGIAPVINGTRGIAMRPETRSLEQWLLDGVDGGHMTADQAIGILRDNLRPQSREDVHEALRPHEIVHELPALSASRA